jgi:hypothetical protein
VRLPLDQRPASARPDHLAERYDSILATNLTRGNAFEQLLSDMDECGVGSAIMHAEYEFGDPADDLNEAVARIVAEHPSRFFGFGTVSLERLRPERCVRQVQEVADLGLRGINIQPCFFGLPIDHRLLYPIYSKATELGLVVAVHTGVNYSTRDPMRAEHPMLLDQVACDFSELKLIACHGGWPWVAEMVAVARRHPHVMIELGGLAPQYLAAAGSGWEVLLRFMDSLLSDQVLFATDWPVVATERAVREWTELPLKSSTLEKALSQNAMRLLGVDAPVGSE